MIFNWSSVNLWSSTQYWYCDCYWNLCHFFSSICVTLELILHSSITFHTFLVSIARKDSPLTLWMDGNDDYLRMRIIKHYIAYFFCIFLTWIYSSSTSLIYSAIKLHFNTTKMVFFSFFFKFPSTLQNFFIFLKNFVGIKYIRKLNFFSKEAHTKKNFISFTPLSNTRMIAASEYG